MRPVPENTLPADRGVLGDALTICSSRVRPILPPYGGIRESMRSRGCRTSIDRLLTYTCFVKENAPKNFAGSAR